MRSVALATVAAMMLGTGAAGAADPQPAAKPATAKTAAVVDPSRMSQSEIDLLQALTSRRDALEQREEQLSTREATAAAAEARLAARTDELNKLKADLEA